jgi:hypothetical protein
VAARPRLKFRSPCGSYVFEMSVRAAEDYFCDLPDLTIAPDMLTLAEHILDPRHGKQLVRASYRGREDDRRPLEEPGARRR